MPRSLPRWSRPGKPKQPSAPLHATATATHAEALLQCMVSLVVLVCRCWRPIGRNLTVLMPVGGGDRDNRLWTDCGGR